ncbi:hypothetical protein NEOLEDRAFT_1053426 [Neolentinus lepideus HHB14362 ss-1]|uniref:Uncharacterized protein n=1 Tax=Neolentinus lepideus HHB14362 ss-1 TaxID=1314782 RepID=A0A165W5F3_9AGAM|nr:hypothetical protein NEOLEDRAFT_1053426 [Neolentinus lepideus HHB14362 ss-1]
MVAPKRQATSRPSLPPTQNSRPPSSASVRAARVGASASISSMKDIKEDGRAIELQNKLKDVEAALKSKLDAISALESEATQLKSSLEVALADAAARQQTVDELQVAKTKAEEELEEVRASLASLQSEQGGGSAQLQAIHEELVAAKEAAAMQNDLVENLQSQIDTLQAEVAAARENLDVLRASNESATAEAAAVASIEHAALEKAKADLDAIQAESEALQKAHVAALEEAQTRVSELENKAAQADALAAEVAELTSEKDETANKLSELEIEILELKEAQEKAEDERTESLAHIKALEVQLAEATVATQQVLEEAKAKEEEHAQKLGDAEKSHFEALQAASDEQAKVMAQLETLKEELAQAQSAHEQAKADAQAAAEEHVQKLDEVEKFRLEKETELTQELERVKSELEGQEAAYNAKVDTVKAEHDQLLQEAFERAKSEAGSAHGEDLHALRAESQATIEQLREAHQLTIEGLKAEHEAALETQVKTLEKHITSLQLELKATQDDLLKAKAALVAAAPEVDALKVQLEEARNAASAVASSSPEHAAEVERLTEELTIAKDDLAALSDVLNVTRESISEMSSNHVKELEEAAKSRAEEVTKLRASHEQEVNALLREKEDLLLRLSDVEGELATVKAQTAAGPVASPKNNSNGHARTPSVTKDELQKLHEAHNLKLNDLQSEHARAVKALREELEIAQNKADELQQEVARKAMEIQYLEQDQEESQDQITRYVKLFGLKSFLGGIIALSVVYGLL